jgi:CRISPR/Cas system CSM-associated protein Csm5 (group 7 of RAMP superfamily)
MGKYASGLTLKQVCELEVEELKTILSKYDISKEDKEEIENMVQEGYFQAHQLARSGRVLERLLEENNIKADLKRYQELDKEEEQKYKW